MISFYQFLESQEPQQRTIPIGGFGGWKIHLRTGPVDSNRDFAYQYVLEIIKDNGNKWKSKKLSGGDPNQKDITIYCGPKEQANNAARAIKNHRYLYNMLFPPNTDIAQDDIQILPDVPNVYGRFSASILDTRPYTFHQYGCKGWSMLKSDVEKRMMARYLKDKGMSYEKFDSTKACKIAYIVLEKLFGKDFTG